jgi:hypothetical protein
MEAFKVAPYDQNLCLNGLYLTDSSMTLGQLRVLPKSLIYLRADEPNPSAAVIEPDDGWAMQHPEEGFKGNCGIATHQTFTARYRVSRQNSNNFV